MPPLATKLKERFDMDLDPDLDEVYQQIMAANRPEDLFGVEDVILPVKTLNDFLTGEFNRFSSLLDPSRYVDIDDQEAADEARQRLHELHAEAREKISRFHFGLYGYNAQRPNVSQSFDIGDNRYYIGNKLEDGEFYTLFQAYLERRGTHLGETVIKLSRDHQTNHLLQREARALDLLHKQDMPQWKHLPFILDRFESRGRTGLVFRKNYGLTLSEVRRKKAHLKGVDQKHVSWMLDRAFSLFGYVHHCGIVHGALTPDKLVINDRMHNVFATNWEVSIHNPALTREKVELFNDPHDPFISPEVLEGGEIGPWSDIYSLGKIFIWLIGGDPETDSVPNSVETPIRNFLREMVRKDHRRRSADCWELYEEHCRIRDRLWPRKFLHFDVS